MFIEFAQNTILRMRDQGVAMDAITHVEVENCRTSDVTQNKKHTALFRHCQIFLAEFLATGFLVFMICSGCLKLNNEPISLLQISFASGFAVASLVQIFGHISDCHMNPAVTVLFFSKGEIKFFTAIIYILAEITGACAGYGVLWFLTPTSIQDLNMPGHCETNPHPALGPILAAFIELIITSLLMFLICACRDPRNAHKQDSAPIKFGYLITLVALCAGSLTGASMNPARSFAPALWHNQWAHHWVYWVAPSTAGYIIPKLYEYCLQKDYTVKPSN